MKISNILLSLLISAALSSTSFAGSSPKGKPFVAINDQIVEVNGAISSIEEQIEELVASVDTLEERVGANEQAITDLQDENAILETLVAENATDIATINALISDLQAENDQLAIDIAANTGDIATLQATVDANASLIATLQAAIVDVNINLGIGLADLQGQIDNNLALIGGLQGQISNINSLLAAKQNIVNGTCPSGYSIRQIYPNGSVACEYDDTGSTSISRVVVSRRTDGAATGSWHSVTVACPSGYTVTGGGFHMHDQKTQESQPYGNGWRVATFNNGYFRDIIVYANCIRLN
ncbi:MAG: hypothetical protein IMF07_07790 [Proteobacteria bacterium]|nr:hypothetical protein [Pseudomonadota bacterium]